MLSVGTMSDRRGFDGYGVTGAVCRGVSSQWLLQKAAGCKDLTKMLFELDEIVHEIYVVVASTITPNPVSLHMVDRSP